MITVPAIWRQEAKQFMREAAYQAGIASRESPGQLVIALEPEAPKALTLASGGPISFSWRRRGVHDRIDP